jgi:hypothetical protein
MCLPAKRHDGRVLEPPDFCEKLKELIHRDPDVLNEEGFVNKNDVTKVVQFAEVNAYTNFYVFSVVLSVF